MKVVINRCWGGFHLSEKAFDRLIELGIPLLKTGYTEDQRPCSPYIYDTEGQRWGRYYWSSADDKDRAHPLLVQVVEELGEDSYDHSVSKLKIVEVPDDVDWYIHDYDGQESVEESHSSWS